MTGGLATIVTRLAEKGKTKIRGGEKVVQKIVGLDFIALYLESMCHYDMPTGYCTHWTATEGGTFQRKSETIEEKLKRRLSHGEVHFMQYAAYRDKVYIHHSGHGSQTRLTTRQWPVDGYAKDAKPKPRVYEYFGCHFHYHGDGCLNKNAGATEAAHKRKELDVEKAKDLIEQGFDYQVAWECWFQAVKNLAPDLRSKKPVSPTTDPELLEEAKTYNDFPKDRPRRKFYNKNQVAYQKCLQRS